MESVRLPHAKAFPTLGEPQSSSSSLVLIRPPARRMICAPSGVALRQTMGLARRVHLIMDRRPYHTAAGRSPSSSSREHVADLFAPPIA